MAFCTDREDVVSLSLTAVHRLLEKYGVDPAHVGRCATDETSCLCKHQSVRISAGVPALLSVCAAADRLEVGTESNPDRSKSIKTYLMPLFEAAGNHAVEVSTVARCTPPVLGCTDGIRQPDCRLIAV